MGERALSKTSDSTAHLLSCECHPLTHHTSHKTVRGTLRPLWSNQRVPLRASPRIPQSGLSPHRAAAPAVSLLTRYTSHTPSVRMCGIPLALSRKLSLPNAPFCSAALPGKWQYRGTRKPQPHTACDPVWTGSGLFGRKFTAIQPRKRSAQESCSNKASWTDAALRG